MPKRSMPVKANMALYIGGMGARDKNFYNDLARRLGYEEEAARIEALPRLGSARGRIVNDSGTAVGGAAVALSGPNGQSYTLTTGPDGRFFQADMPPGTYTARIDTEGYLIRQDSFDVVAREGAD